MAVNDETLEKNNNLGLRQQWLGHGPAVSIKQFTDAAFVTVNEGPQLVLVRRNVGHGRDNVTRTPVAR